ncbi:MAG: prephenate dehydrogenase [Leptospiraceae bacterium]|nr:prephenate dehydrogenase [Leptospiraceae bacterium]
MGASLSLAIRQKNLPFGRIDGVVRSVSSRDEGLKLKVADSIFLESEFKEKDLWNDYGLIIYSLPVNLTCEKIAELPLSYRGIVTDLGSTKREIIEAVEKKYSSSHRYYSSHPMAGSEHSGLKYAQADLYEARLCILTPPKRVEEGVEDFIRDFWEKIGMYTLKIEAEEHDKALAYISHSPHILSSIMTNWCWENPTVSEKTGLSPIPLTGGGFRDMSRIAGSNPEMWDAIIETNREPIRQSLIDFRDRLNVLIGVLGSNSEVSGFWKKFFDKAKKSRDRILKLE